MALYKVEICGVNTSKLPLLKNSEKEELFQRILKGDKEARSSILGEIYVLYYPLSSGSPIVMKMWMTYFRLAASD